MLRNRRVVCDEKYKVRAHRGWRGEGVGGKQKLMERQRQRASQPVRWKKKKGKQSVEKELREERESICHHRLPQLLTDYSGLQNSLCCVCVCVY